MPNMAYAAMHAHRPVLEARPHLSWATSNQQHSRMWWSGWGRYVLHYQVCIHTCNSSSQDGLLQCMRKNLHLCLRHAYCLCGMSSVQAGLPSLARVPQSWMQIVALVSPVYDETGPSVCAMPITELTGALFVPACSIHAASVVQMTHMLLCHGGLIKSGLITKTQQLSSYWSAAVHDYEHGGLNNDFLIKTSHALAVRYNDQSPLENHHMSAAVQLLFQPDYSYIAVRCAGPFTCFCWRWLHNKQHLSWVHIHNIFVLHGQIRHSGHLLRLICKQK